MAREKWAGVVCFYPYKSVYSFEISDNTAEEDCIGNPLFLSTILTKDLS